MANLATFFLRILKLFMPYVFTCVLLGLFLWKQPDRAQNSRGIQQREIDKFLEFSVANSERGRKSMEQYKNSSEQIHEMFNENTTKQKAVENRTSPLFRQINTAPTYRVPQNKSGNEYDLKTSKKESLNNWNETNLISTLKFDAGNFSNEVAVVFSVTPKCGSRTLLMITQNLKDKNNIGEITTLVDYNKIERSPLRVLENYLNGAIETGNQRLFIYTHGFFLPYTKETNRNIVRISIVRDPLERKISHYNYQRYRDSEPNTPEEQVWRNHLSKIKLRNESFDECVKQKRSECLAGKFRIRLILQYCGYERKCQVPSRWALERAKQNVIDNYLVVGLMEDYSSFIQVLEKIMPTFFTGAMEQYDSLIHSTDFVKMKTNRAAPPSNETITNMKELMKLDFEFYDFLKERFTTLKRNLGIS